MATAQPTRRRADATASASRDGDDPTDVDAVLDRMAEQLEAHEPRAAPDAQPTLDAHG